MLREIAVDFREDRSLRNESAAFPRNHRPATATAGRQEQQSLLDSRLPGLICLPLGRVQNRFKSSQFTFQPGQGVPHLLERSMQFR